MVAKNLAEEDKTRKIRKKAGVGYAILQVCKVQPHCNLSPQRTYSKRRAREVSQHALLPMPSDRFRI